MEVNYDKIEAAVRMILEAVGEDPDREGLLDTPKRVAKMYAEMFSGLGKNPEDEISAIFNEMHEEVVIVKDIPFFSMCEHHLVPFYGKAHVAYIPTNGRVTGLSKLARIVETIARQPQLQERITSTVADTLVNKLEPKGVAVIIEAEHMCMTMRGVRKPGASTITTSVRGLYQEDSQARAEVFSLMRG